MAARAKTRLAAAESRRRQAQDELTEIHDHATREVWTAYINFRSALRKNDAAISRCSNRRTLLTPLRSMPITRACAI